MGWALKVGFVGVFVAGLGGCLFLFPAPCNDDGDCRVGQRCTERSCEGPGERPDPIRWPWNGGGGPLPFLGPDRSDPEPEPTLCDPDRVKWSPDEVWVDGTLVESVVGYRMVASPFTPSTGAWGLPVYAYPSVIDRNGDWIYWYAIGSEEVDMGLYRFRPDVAPIQYETSGLCEGGADFARMENDDLVAHYLSACPIGHVDRLLARPDDDVVYLQCGDAWNRDDGTTLMSGNDPVLHAVGMGEARLVEQHYGAGAPDLRIERAGRPDIDIVEYPARRLVTVRPTDEGFLVVLGDARVGELWLFDYHLDGTSAFLGTYPMDPSILRPLLDAEAALWWVASDPRDEPGEGHDAIYRAPVGGEVERVYTEYDDPRIKTHGGGLYTGYYRPR